MQLNKYLQYIIRQETKNETETLDKCLQLLQQRKEEKLKSYLMLVRKRMESAR